MKSISISKKEIENLYNVSLKANTHLFYIEQPEKSCGIGNEVLVRIKAQEGICGFSTDCVVNITDVSAW